MIYISVDNDHHGGLALSLIKKHGFVPEEVMFISHISRRNNTIPASSFNRQVIAGHPLSNGSGYKNVLTYVKSFLHQRLLNRIFKFSEQDMLLIITEYQINNALLARKMKESGGKVYLFDEGIGFYFNNSPFHKARTSALGKVYLLLYNCAFYFLNIPAYAKKGFEGRMYVRIKDEFIDCIYSRMRLPIDRPCRVEGYRNFLATEQASERKNADSAIFFANNLEPFGLKNEELKLSGETIGHMTTVFKTVYLKIHPADLIEQNDVFHFYKNLVDLHVNVQLVDNTLTGNDAMEKFRPLMVVGTLGATMFDAFFFGCQPVFLFHLLPPIPEFDICRYTLDNMGYRYINDIAEISPDYRSDVDITTLIYQDTGAPLDKSLAATVSASAPTA